MAKGTLIKKKRVSILQAPRKQFDLGNDVVHNRVTMAPVAQNRSAGQTRGGSLRFKESERIATVPGSVSFGVSGSVACNPGLAGSFPWLAGHANLFERYRIHKLVYRYKNLKGTASNGNVLMSFDYDTLDNPPATAIEMTQSTVYVDGAPWRIFELSVPCDKRDLFTRSAAVAGADLKTYDMGKLHIAAEGCADTSPHGYLEVEYDVELFMKQSITTGSAAASYGAVTAGVVTTPIAGLTMSTTLAGTLSQGTWEITNGGTGPIGGPVQPFGAGIAIPVGASALVVVTTATGNFSSAAAISALFFRV